MIRLSLLALAALTLTVCNGSSADINRAIAALTGDAQPEAYALVENDVPVSSEEAATSSEPPCVPGTGTYDNRFMLYDSCTNELIGPDPKYW
jgi:hypothetical protein